MMFYPGTISSCLPRGPRRGRLPLAAAWIALVALGGCDRGPAMYQVRGKVFYKDGSVPTGAVCVVNLQPLSSADAEVRKGASGAIGPDGSFELYTRRPGDGVIHGEYQVGFVVLKSVSDPQSLVQPKYANPATSGYTVTVDRDIEDLKFEIEPLPGAPRAAASGGPPRTSG
jgi:hypothetical protein